MRIVQMLFFATLAAGLVSCAGSSTARSPSAAASAPPTSELQVPWDSVQPMAPPLQQSTAPDPSPTASVAWVVPVWAPSETYTPSPVANKALARFHTFAKRSAADTKKSVDAVGGVLGAMDAHDASSALFAVASLGRWLTSELHWYSSHAPRSCYGSAQTMFVRYLKLLNDGVVPLITGLTRDATFWLNNAYIDRGLADWKTADSYLRKATAAIKKVDCGG